jgi:hypothetical protein
MTKIDLNSTILTVPSVSQSDLESVHRFIVLVPPLEADFTFVTSRIWELANAMGAHVLFIGLYNDAAQEPSLRRELVTMSAMVNYGKVSAEIEVLFGRDWVGAVRSHWQAGDMLMCFVEQPPELPHGPLSQIQGSNLNVPLYLLNGLYPQNDSQKNWLTETAAWIGSIVIISGFFFLLIWIGNIAKDWATVFQMLAILVEVWMILAWNGIFR